MGTTWSDVSQYQRIPVDDRYPHPVFCFRTNTGDTTDSLAVENGRRALDMLNRGKLRAVIAYYFFWPGQANCDLHRRLLEQAGLWGDPRLVSMIDIEGAPKNGVKRVRGDQSAEANDELERVAGWHSNRRRVIGYWNPVADPELWLNRPDWLRLIVPSYGRTPGQPLRRPPGYFAHQYTDRGQCAPWPDGVDLNFTDLELPDLLASLGIQGGKTVTDVVTEGAGQLHPHADRIRPILNPGNVNPSTRTPAEPWPYDMSADVWNETVWDGFKLPSPDELNDDPKSLVGWTLDTAARARKSLALLESIDGKLDRLLKEEGR